MTYIIFSSGMVRHVSAPALNVRFALTQVTDGFAPIQTDAGESLVNPLAVAEIVEDEFMDMPTVEVTDGPLT